MRFLQVLGLGTLTACQVALVPSPSSEDGTESSDPQTGRIPLAQPTLITENAELSDSSDRSENANNSLTTAVSPAAHAHEGAYADAIQLASAATRIAQRATSLDDWSLAVSWWEQVVNTLEQIPTTDPNYLAAQAKLGNYEQQLAQVRQHLKSLQSPPPDMPVVTRQPSPQLSAPSQPPQPTARPTPAVENTLQVPIVERRSGIPVIEVSFNGKPYPMILDTGASHTHLPRAMAEELGIQVRGHALVSTASSHQVRADVGDVASIRVGPIERTNVPVSIGDTVPIGLLGNDVYQDYDIILQADSVEFRPR